MKAMARWICFVAKTYVIMLRHDLIYGTLHAQ